MTYNEGKRIGSCLKSIFSQDYPKEKLEVIVVDDASTDNTLAIAKKYPVKIYMNGKKDADLSATIGFNNATGDFFTAIGADMQFYAKDWFRKMIKPLMENPDMAFALTTYYSHPKDSLINKYINLDEQQRDFVYQLFTPNYSEMITEKRKGYYIMKYSPDKIPPQTHGLYRVKVMREIIKKQKIYYDMGNLMLLVKNGHTKVGYVPKAGYYHFHVDSLSHLLKKRIRNVERSYLRYSEKKETKRSHYKWVDFKKPSHVIKLIALVLGSNLFIPLFIISIFRMIKHKNYLYLLEAPITFLTVDTLIYVFLKNPQGRKFIFNSFRSIIS